jgi:hypothetical protein
MELLVEDAVKGPGWSSSESVTVMTFTVISLCLVAKKCLDNIRVEVVTIVSAYDTYEHPGLQR